MIALTSTSISGAILYGVCLFILEVRLLTVVPQVCKELKNLEKILDKYRSINVFEIDQISFPLKADI